MNFFQVWCLDIAAMYFALLVAIVSIGLLWYEIYQNAKNLIGFLSQHLAWLASPS